MKLLLPDIARDIWRRHRGEVLLVIGIVAVITLIWWSIA